MKKQLTKIEELSEKKKKCSSKQPKIRKESEDYQEISSQCYIPQSEMQLKQKRKRNKCEGPIHWTNAEISKLFTFYDLYGSKWSLIEKYFQQKSQNALKNKFYGTLKSLLRALFKRFSIIGHNIHILPSNQISQIYQGKKKFAKFQGFLKSILVKMEFKLVKEEIYRISEEREDQLQQLLTLIFEEKTNHIPSITQDKIEQKQNFAEKLVENQEKIQPHPIPQQHENHDLTNYQNYLYSLENYVRTTYVTNQIMNCYYPQRLFYY